MKIKNIIDSINCVDFLNKIDNIIYKLLYDEKEGYILKESKDAIDNAERYVEKFDNEINNIIQNEEFDIIKPVIEEKRKEFILKIKEHYIDETTNRAMEVYKNLEDNSILGAFIYKNNKEMLDKIYNRMLCAISWISNVKKFNEKEKENLLIEFREHFIKSINSKDSDYLMQNKSQKTNPKVFLKIFNMILDDEEKFLVLDLNEFSNNLNRNDLNYFNLVKNYYKTYKKSSKKDEISLIKAALELCNLKDDKEKYQFITSINEDFLNHYSENKKIDEPEKINLVKKRIEIILKYKNSNNDYYKKLLSSKNTTSLND